MPLALLCKQARALLGALTSNSARSPSKVTIDAVLGVQLPRSDLPTVLGSRRQARGKATNYAGIDKAQVSRTTTWSGPGPKQSQVLLTRTKT